MNIVVSQEQQTQTHICMFSRLRVRAEAEALIISDSNPWELQQKRTRAESERFPHNDCSTFVSGSVSTARGGANV